MTRTLLAGDDELARQWEAFMDAPPGRQHLAWLRGWVPRERRAGATCGDPLAMRSGIGDDRCMDVAERIALLAQRMGIASPIGRASDLEVSVWQDGAGCHLATMERGSEISRFTERDPEVFCFRVLEEAAREEAKRVPNEVGKDHRRSWFPRHVELMRRVSDEWAERVAEAQQRELEDAPFTDRPLTPLEQEWRKRWPR